MSLSGARENVKSVKTVLESMRSEDQFLAIWADTMELADTLKLKPPKLGYPEPVAQLRGTGGGLSTPQSKIGVPCNSSKSEDFFSSLLGGG